MAGPDHTQEIANLFENVILPSYRYVDALAGRTPALWAFDGIEKEGAGKAPHPNFFRVVFQASVSRQELSYSVVMGPNIVNECYNFPKRFGNYNICGQRYVMSQGN